MTRNAGHFTIQTPEAAVHRARGVHDDHVVQGVTDGHISVIAHHGQEKDIQSGKK